MGRAVRLEDTELGAQQAGTRTSGHIVQHRLHREGVRPAYSRGQCDPATGLSYFRTEKNQVLNSVHREKVRTWDESTKTSRSLATSPTAAPGTFQSSAQSHVTLPLKWTAPEDRRKIRETVESTG